MLFVAHLLNLAPFLFVLPRPSLFAGRALYSTKKEHLLNLAPFLVLPRPYTVPWVGC